MITDLLEPSWEDLLDYIDEGKVIPVVGPRLVTVRGPQGETSLARQLAVQLAERLRLPADDLPENYQLNDIVGRFVQKGGRKSKLYLEVQRLLKEAAFPPPRNLLNLASITDFKLFVSLTCDSLLADALNRVRYGGVARTEEIAYSPNEVVKDLKSDKEDLVYPVVFHLLGQLSVSPDYVICDEDLLEFLHALQDHENRPKRLFDELRDSHLLLLGCHFADWLVRFFIRTAKGQKLSQDRKEMEVLVDSGMEHDAGLVVFLKHFSDGTLIWPGRADDFTGELARRWQERHPHQDQQQPPVSSPVEVGADGDQMEAGAIFISYASEDLRVAEQIKAALEAKGFNVWFDKKRLAAGDEWDRKIRRNIATCSLLLAIVSHATEARPEAYFRREWKWAADRAEGIANDVTFIVPVSVDELAAESALVPDGFRRIQWAKLPGGRVTDEFTDRLKALVRDYQKRQRGAAHV